MSEETYNQKQRETILNTANYRIIIIITKKH